MKRAKIGAAIGWLCLVFAVVTGCSDSSSNSSGSDTDTSVRMNQVQYLGTHNSYKQLLRRDLFEILTSFVPDIARTLDYGHLPLPE
ncbi:MAG: hypothetical protein GY887_14595, partial [Halieaceae bacterium]|nr:hypothetical protein [Halieaceae bacterium]